MANSPERDLSEFTIRFNKLVIPNYYLIARFNDILSSLNYTKLGLECRCYHITTRRVCMQVFALNINMKWHSGNGFNARNSWKF